MKRAYIRIEDDTFGCMYEYDMPMDDPKFHQMMDGIAENAVMTNADGTDILAEKGSFRFRIQINYYDYENK